MSNKAWKNEERRVGLYFGVLRNIGSGTMGRTDRTGADLKHPKLFVEVKHAKSYAVVKQAVKNLSKQIAGSRYGLSSSGEKKDGIIMLKGGRVSLEASQLVKTGRNLFLALHDTEEDCAHEVMLKLLDSFDFCQFRGGRDVFSDYENAVIVSRREVDEQWAMEADGKTVTGVGLGTSKLIPVLAYSGPGQVSFNVVCHLMDLPVVAMWAEAAKCLEEGSQPVGRQEWACEVNRRIEQLKEWPSSIYLKNIAEGKKGVSDE